MFRRVIHELPEDVLQAADMDERSMNRLADSLKNILPPALHEGLGEILYEL